MKFRLQSLNDVVTNSSMEVYKEGLEAILDKYFKDNYKIEYE